MDATTGETTVDDRRPGSIAAPAVETLGLRKVYGRKVAVDSLTLAVARGEVFGFLGPNGAGKSTVVKLLMGLIFPSAGSARLLGQPVGDDEIKRRIGFLPELFRFHEWLKAREFLEFHGRLYGMEKGQLARRIPAVLEMVNLASRAGDHLRTFSKGMLQRVGIAQALLNNPDIVFLDEPTSALDPLGRREVRDLIRELKLQGKTVFLNSHLLSEVEMVCDRVAILDRGRIVRQGLLRDLLADSHEVQLQVGAVDEQLLGHLAGRYHVLGHDAKTITLGVPDREDIPSIAELVLRHGVRLYGLSERRRSLEDFFVAAVEGASDQ